MSASAKRILIVEDDSDIALVLSTILEDAGYTVQTSDGSDFLMWLQERKPPDLILLDMLLSGQDGREIARQVKGQPETSHVPIIMLSAHPTAGRDALAAGADGFLAKPFDLENLLARVATYLK